ncbi:MAG: hypothetical protein V3T83_05365 [Acidobacteriota bacterium]
MRTVVYSSLFDFPLTLRELRSNLLEATADQGELGATLRHSRPLQQVLEVAEGFVFLRGKRDCIQRRRQRESRSRRLLEENRWVLKLICAVPCTRLVALSGSAAHANVNRGGDIDLLIVTSGKRVWWAAVSILLLTKLLGRRQTLCFNFILSERHLKVEPEDLFSANQMIHLKPLIGEDLCRRFLEENPFVRRFYPSAEVGKAALDCRPGAFLAASKKVSERVLSLGLGAVLELTCRKAYSAYLRSKARGWSSPDQVVLGQDYLKLHTESHRMRILESFDKACTKALQRIADQAVGNRRRQEAGGRRQEEGETSREQASSSGLRSGDLGP